MWSKQAHEHKTHTHAHTDAHTFTHACIHRGTHTHTLTHTHTHTHAHSTYGWIVGDANVEKHLLVTDGELEGDDMRAATMADNKCSGGPIAQRALSLPPILLAHKPRVGLQRRLTLPPRVALRWR